MSSCNKMVQVPEPVNTITASETYNTEANAIAEVLGIYSDMTTGINKGLSFSNGIISLYAGLSADELNYFNASGDRLQFQTNTLQSTTGTFYNQFWSTAYKDIYYANTAIEGVQASQTISQPVKNQLTGEAKFLRAFLHFYLINLFGDVPLVTTTSWSSTSLLSRTPVAQVYSQIIADLKDAQGLLTSDYAFTGGERIRATRWAAAALLARVYLYNGDWANAELQATSVIDNTSLYQLEEELNNSFLAGSREAILQLQISANYFPYCTMEGYNALPVNFTSAPTYYLSPQLLSAFEPLDKRYTAWVDSTFYRGKYYYVPYKYKIKQGEAGTTPAEYYILLRLSEQYLIRAEGRARLGESGADEDLNIVRNRAGLSNTTASTQTELLDAIAHERQIELFAEWGHRWLDLKRTDKADAVLSVIKPLWQPAQKLYPIPVAEISSDPNLTQNPGYQ